jgi:hypothetical protein
MTARRFVLALALGATAAATAIGCGFGRANDTGKPIPGQYWGWACADGGAPDGPGGCVGADAAVNDASDAGGDR